MSELDKVDLKRALLVPSSVFDGPEAVVTADGLTREQKIEVLRRWEFDVRRMQVADDEVVDGEPLFLGRVHAALEELGAEGEGAGPPEEV